MQYLPIKYYLLGEINSDGVALDFQDARKGKLLDVAAMEGSFIALVQQDNGEVTMTDATFVKIIGDDTKRTIARMIDEIKKMKDDFVPLPLHSQFQKDLENLKNTFE